jgi:hypothetical protein
MTATTAQDESTWGLPTGGVWQGTFPFLKIFSETMATNDLGRALMLAGGPARPTSGLLWGPRPSESRAA